jgi:hypothetical protein
MKNGVPEKNVSIKGRWIVIGNVSGECSGSILVK